MVSTLQRLLEVTQNNRNLYKDKEFFAHLALAKKLHDSNHIDLALKRVPESISPDVLISFIFECTVCSFETLLPFVTACQTKKYRARAYCILATHFPDKKAECLEKALKDADKNDKVYYQIARTFQNVVAANKISGCYKRTIALLELCIENLEADPTKADRIFRQALLTEQSGREICDLYRAIALKASLLKLKESPFYTKGYFATLEKMEAKTQARHCKPLFKELIAKDTAAAVTTVENAKKIITIVTQGALMIAEAPGTDIFAFTSMITLAKKSIASLDKSSFKNHATIRLAILRKSSRFPKKVDKNVVTTARWIRALFCMGKKKKAIPYIRDLPSQVKAYLESITTASSDHYHERRDTLLKAALKLIEHLPDIALELVGLALPTLANGRLYITDVEAVVAFAIKQTPTIQERITTQVAEVLKRHRKLHSERPDNVRMFIELANSVDSLSHPLALELIDHARTVKSMWKPEQIADALGTSGAFKDVQQKLYEEALIKDPQNIKLLITLAELSPSEKKEELLGKALDIALMNKSPNDFQGIIDSFL